MKQSGGRRAGRNLVFKEERNLKIQSKSASLATQEANFASLLGKF